MFKLRKTKSVLKLNSLTKKIKIIKLKKYSEKKSIVSDLNKFFRKVFCSATVTYKMEIKIETNELIKIIFCYLKKA